MLKKCSQTEATEFEFSRSFQGQIVTVTNCRHGQGKVNKAETGQKKWREDKRQERKWRHSDTHNCGRPQTPGSKHTESWLLLLICGSELAQSNNIQWPTQITRLHINTLCRICCYPLLFVVTPYCLLLPPTVCCYPALFVYKVTILPPLKHYVPLWTFASNRKSQMHWPGVESRPIYAVCVSYNSQKKQYYFHKQKSLLSILDTNLWGRQWTFVLNFNESQSSNGHGSIQYKKQRFFVFQYNKTCECGHPLKSAAVTVGNNSMKTATYNVHGH